MYKRGLLQALCCLVSLSGATAFLPQGPVLETSSRSHGRTANVLLMSESDDNFFASLNKEFSNFFGNLFGGGGTSVVSAAPEPEPVKLKRRTGGPVTLVFGATGRTGQEVVKALLARGHDVIAGVRNQTKAESVFGALATAATPAAAGHGLLEIKTGVDVTNPASLKAELFEDVTQSVAALGPVGGPQPGGGYGFFPGSTSEDVDYKGVVNALEAMKQNGLKSQWQAGEKNLFNFQSAADLEKWERLDDVIMGGKSSSSLSLKDGYADFTGDLVVEDGGFCGTRAKNLNVKLGGFDGLRLKVQGDGYRYKLTLKTKGGQGGDNTYNAPENVYQVSFDTVAGAWTTVDIPFNLFLPVVRNKVVYKAPRLQPGRRSNDGPIMESLALVYSRFEYNKLPNPSYKPGAFSLKVKEISTYRAARPAFLLVSSAGSERNAKVETEEERLAEIPIVQLNPGGILNWKYRAESHIRGTDLPYTIIRGCGLVPEQAFPKGPSRLQAGQGDRLTGTLTRADLAEAIGAALDSPYAAYKTLELRRDEAEDGRNKPTEWDGLYKGLVKDTDRVVAGILPFPEPTDPPGDVSDERRKEVLADPRVQASVERDAAIKKEKELANA